MLKESIYLVQALSNLRRPISVRMPYFTIRWLLYVYMRDHDWACVVQEKRSFMP